MSNLPFVGRSLLFGIAAVAAIADLACAQCEVGRIVGSGVAEYSEFGAATSIDGEFAAVEGTANVYLFRRNANGGWQEVKVIAAPDAMPGQGFGLSLMLRGDRLAVGAPYDSGLATAAGAVYIFERHAGGVDNWGFVKKIQAIGGLAFDHFGDCVAIEGDLLVAGAPDSDDAGSNTGAAYVFRRNQGGPDQWGQVKRLTASDAAGGNYFGDSVSVFADAVIVGATYAAGAASQSGVVYAFVQDHGGVGNWGQAARIFASDGHAGDRFGISVSLSANDVAVGAPDAETLYNNWGAAYVFHREDNDPTLWTFKQKVTGSDLEDTPEFGFAVELRGNTLIAGNLTDNQNADDAGAAYLFKRDANGLWTESYKLVSSSLAPVAYFGVTVALSAEHALVGAPYDDAVAQNSGSAWIFALNGVDCNANGLCDERDIASGLSVDLNSNGVLDECEVYCQMPPITPSGLPTSSYFGRVIDLTNDALIAGAPSFSLETGSAWVAQRVEGSPSGFGEPVGLTPSWLEAADALGESVAIDGGTAVVGAPGARVILPGSPPVEYAGAGRAFVFQRDARGIWVEIASLRSPAPNQFAAFGAGVDIDGDTVAIGEPNRQCVQIFERNQGGPNAWGHARTIAPSIFSQDLGRSVSLDGDLLVAGAQTENAPLNDSGAAYLFGRDQGGPGNWGLIKKLLASNAAASDRFGCAVAIDGDIVAVGASGVDGSASSPNFGRAYVFEQDLGGDDNWGERTQLHAGAFGRANMEFGKDISVSVNLVLVGAPSKASPFFNPGSAFVFQRDAGGPNSWGGVARMVPRQPAVDDRFGIAVVLDGTTAVVGADYRDHQAPFVGALFVMDVAGADCNINGFCDSFDVLSNASPDDNGNGIPDECEQPTCPADIAGNDGQVDVNDLLAVITTWGPCPAPPTACDADIDNSGTVDVNDLLAVITTWGTCP